MEDVELSFKSRNEKIIQQKNSLLRAQRQLVVKRFFIECIKKFGDQNMRFLSQSPRLLISNQQLYYGYSLNYNSMAWKEFFSMIRLYKIPFTFFKEGIQRSEIKTDVLAGFQQIKVYLIRDPEIIKFYRENQNNLKSCIKAQQSSKLVLQASQSICIIKYLSHRFIRYFKMIASAQNIDYIRIKKKSLLIIHSSKDTLVKLLTTHKIKNNLLIEIRKKLEFKTFISVQQPAIDKLLRNFEKNIQSFTKRLKKQNNNHQKYAYEIFIKLQANYLSFVLTCNNAFDCLRAYLFFTINSTNYKYEQFASCDDFDLSKFIYHTKIINSLSPQSSYFPIPQVTLLYDKIQIFVSNLNKYDYGQVLRLCSFETHLLDQILFILKNWTLYSEIYLKLFNNLIFSIRQISKSPTYKYFYGKLKKIEQQIVKTIQSTPNKMRKVQKDANILYEYFYEQKTSTMSNFIQIRNQKSQRVLLSEYIANTQIFLARSQWKQIFLTTQLITKKDKNAQVQFMNNIENQTQSFGCLGCCIQFHENQNLSKYQQRLHVISSVNNISKHQIGKQIQQYICYFLNNNGGTILFNCKSSYLSILVQGAIITQNKKDEIKAIINTYCKNIQPQITQNIDYFITFVPVKPDPFLEKIQSSPSQYIKGFYITRIQIKVSSKPQFYYWQADDIAYICAKNKKNQIEYVKAHKITKIFKIKFIDRYKKKQKPLINDQMVDMLEQQLNKPINLYNIQYHVCSPPNKGIQISEQIQNQKPQQKYKNVDLLSINRADIKRLRQFLQKQMVNQYELSQKFLQYNFKTKGKIAILKYNIDANQMKNILKKSQSHLDIKSIIVRSVGSMVQLIDRNDKNIMSNDDFQSLTEWMDKFKDKEQIFMLEFINQRKEYYISIQSKEKLIFLYLILNHYHEKSRFKEPNDYHNYAKWTQVQKQRLKIYYPANQRGQTWQIDLQRFNFK